MDYFYKMNLFNNKYEINKYGVVRNTITNRILKNHFNKKCESVSLIDEDKKQHKFAVYVLLMVYVESKYIKHPPKSDDSNITNPISDDPV